MFIIDYTISTGASVMMPLIFIVPGLILRLRTSQAIKAGLMVGIWLYRSEHHRQFDD